MPRGSFVDYVSEVIPRHGSGLHSSSSTLTSSVQRDLSVRSQPRPVSTTGSKYKYSGQHQYFHPSHNFIGWQTRNRMVKFYLEMDLNLVGGGGGGGMHENTDR